MRPSLFLLPMLLSVIAGMSISAHADTIWEVEHARAIARAGGPVSDQDAEFLDRYGATSGTPAWRPYYYDGHRYYTDRRSTHRRLRYGY